MKKDGLQNLVDEHYALLMDYEYICDHLFESHGVPTETFIPKPIIKNAINKRKELYKKSKFSVEISKREFVNIFKDFHKNQVDIGHAKINIKTNENFELKFFNVENFEIKNNVKEVHENYINYIYTNDKKEGKILIDNSSLSKLQDFKIINNDYLEGLYVNDFGLIEQFNAKSKERNQKFYEFSSQFLIIKNMDVLWKGNWVLLNEKFYLPSTIIKDKRKYEKIIENIFNKEFREDVRKMIFILRGATGVSNKELSIKKENSLLKNFRSSSIEIRNKLLSIEDGNELIKNMIYISNGLDLKKTEAVLNIDVVFNCLIMMDFIGLYSEKVGKITKNPFNTITDMVNIFTALNSNDSYLITEDKNLKTRCNLLSKYYNKKTKAIQLSDYIKIKGF